jgi:hypothetical protein
MEHGLINKGKMLMKTEAEMREQTCFLSMQGSRPNKCRGSGCTAFYIRELLDSRIAGLGPPTNEPGWVEDGPPTGEGGAVTKLQRWKREVGTCAALPQRSF